MPAKTYSQQNNERLNKARLASDFQSIQSETKKARSLIQKSQQQTKKATAMLKKGEKGAALVEMASLAQEIDDTYELSKRDLNIARAQSTTQEAIESFAKIEKAVLKDQKLTAIKEVLLIAHSFREKIAQHDNTPYFIILIVGVAADFGDFTFIIGFLIKLFLFYVLWGRGTWKAKTGAKLSVAASKRLAKTAAGKAIIARVALMLGVDSIPVLGAVLPLSTIAVIYAWRKSAKEAQENRIEVSKLEEEAKILQQDLVIA